MKTNDFHKIKINPNKSNNYNNNNNNVVAEFYSD